MENRGEILSCDLHPHKKKLIQAGADRLGLSIITPMTADGKVFRPEWEGKFDLVLVDAPCSGLGVIRKSRTSAIKTQSPWRGCLRSRGPFWTMPGGMSAPGACSSTLPAPSCAGRTSRWSWTFWPGIRNYKGEDFTLSENIGKSEGGMMTLWPHRQGTDGFFICKLRNEE